MPRLPAARQSSRSIVFALAVAASLVAATSCADTPTSTEPARAIAGPGRIAASEMADLLDTSRFLPPELDTLRNEYCRALPWNTQPDPTSKAVCAVFVRPSTNDPFGIGSLRIEALKPFAVRCAAINDSSWQVTGPLHRRWSPGVPGQFRVEPTAADSGETATITPLVPGQYVLNCEVSNEAWGTPPVYASTGVDAYAAERLLRGISISPDTMRAERGEPVRFTVHTIDQYGQADLVDL